MKGPYIIAYDLGTGGNKASLYDVQGNCLTDTFIPFTTVYPAAGWHEQRPLDWWQAVIESTKQLLSKVSINKDDIYCCGISGHSLGVVPLDRKGRLLRDATPIWSDSRPTSQADTFFTEVEEIEWYNLTGNGFPPPLYSVFKIMWYRDHEPEMFDKIDKIIGTKDFINYKLTGQIVTDYSYASGSGIYDLKGWKYSETLIKVAALPIRIFPEIVPSSAIIGETTQEAAEALGLPQHHDLNSAAKLKLRILISMAQGVKINEIKSALILFSK